MCRLRLERLADDVVAVLDALGVADAALVGWSFGGLVAFRVAATALERVERFVLVGSSGVRASVADGFPFGVPEEALERHLVGGERDDRLAAVGERLPVASLSSPPRTSSTGS